jgi:hypothetical protein
MRAAAAARQTVMVLIPLTDLLRFDPPNIQQMRILIRDALVERFA